LVVGEKSGGHLEKARCEGESAPGFFIYDGTPTLLSAAVKRKGMSNHLDIVRLLL
jgi:hypothetical protein